MGELGQVQASDVKHYEPFIIRARAMVIEGREGIRLCRLEMNGRAVLFSPKIRLFSLAISLFSFSSSVSSWVS